MKELVFVSDIGNSTISFGVFSSDTLIAKTSIPTKGSELDQIKSTIFKMVKEAKLEGETFKGGLISSVVPNLSRIVQIAINSVINIEIPIMDKRYNSLVNVNVDNKDEIGGDLLADILGATTYYKAPLLIVDVGTITKFLLIDETNTFVATNFFPGMGLSMNVMGEKTALLPELEIKKPNQYMGTNTIDAMESGLYYGTIHMIEGYLNRLNKEYEGRITPVLTGGYSSLIKDSLSSFIYDNDLTLKGILCLYRKGLANGL